VDVVINTPVGSLPLTKSLGMFRKGTPFQSQVISGAGFPEASHVAEIFFPSIAFHSDGNETIFGLTGKKKNSVR
jgi:hypothetical protein